MSRPQTYEQSLLNRAESILLKFSPEYEEKLLVIEACAAIYGKFNIEEYWSTFEITPVNVEKVKEAGYALFEAINSTSIPPSMAISSLSREPITVCEKKKQGAFYTDFRLAKFVADDCDKYLKMNSNIADLSAGSGILLAGIAEKYRNKFSKSYDMWITNHVFAFDLSPNALRGARIALAVHTASVKALAKMNENWKICDSLITDDIADLSFDIVVGNPPWGKVKLLLHSFVNSTGVHHIYGSDYEGFDENQYQESKQNALEYGKILKEKYSLLGDAEPDMYMAFLQRAMAVIKPSGHLAYIVPAGLIRSQGTEQIRRYILKESKELKYYLLDNKARFFEIDSRFKFVIVSHDKATSQNQRCSEFLLSICTSKEMDICCGDEVHFDISELKGIRPDLTVPECRTASERDLFFKICKNGHSWKDEWSVDILREVDMTNNRPDFHTKISGNDIPVIEGRMVQQFRFGAKSYVSGSGRSAKWMPCSGKLRPQFYIFTEKLSKHLQDRITSYRVGYCDIAGQTNERAMMSAIIPPDVVCGNKVPTIRFLGDKSNDYMYFWLGVTNSFVFDWLIRRIISTTINFFLLFSMPMPNVDINSQLARDIISKSKELSDMDSEFYTGDKMAKLRANIDVLVAQAFGLSFSELELIMQDFPLLDRAQNTLDNEKRSSVTKDMLLSFAEKVFLEKEHVYTRRYKKELAMGVKAYIPTEMVDLCIGRKE